MTAWLCDCNKWGFWIVADLLKFWESTQQKILLKRGFKKRCVVSLDCRKLSGFKYIKGRDLTSWGM